MIYDVNYTYVPEGGSGPRKVAMATIEADSYEEAAAAVETQESQVIVRMELDARF